MIVYESNRHWFKDILHLSRSWTMQKIRNSVLAVGLYTGVVIFGLEFFDLDPRLHSGIFSLLGVLLSILLVFRTNSAYDRWWEGRKQWGALVNNTRNLAAYLHASLPKEDREQRAIFARDIANFCHAFVWHLRQGADVEQLINIGTDEKSEYAGKDHLPNFIVYQIYQRIKAIYGKGTFSDGDLINLQPMHKSLLDILGACERIKKTPIPFSYAVYIKIFVTAYGIILPFGLYDDFGYYAIPLVMFVFFALIGLELMAEEIEEPFGLDCNDLPTGDIANTIERNVFEIFEVGGCDLPKEEKPEYAKVF